MTRGVRCPFPRRAVGADRQRGGRGVDINTFFREKGTSAGSAEQNRSISSACARSTAEVCAWRVRPGVATRAYVTAMSTSPIQAFDERIERLKRAEMQRSPSTSSARSDGEEDGVDAAAAKIAPAPGCFGTRLAAMKRTVNEYLTKIYRDERSLCYFEKDSNVRAWCLRLSENHAFEFFVLAVVGFNAAVLAMELPERAYAARGGSVPLTKNGSWIVQLLFVLIFTFEACLKTIAHGFAFGRNVYLGQLSNVFDFMVVLVGIIDLSLTGVSAVGTLRLLRTIQPLRALNRFKSGRMVLETMRRSIPLLMDVVVFMSWFVIICTVVGVMLFGGSMTDRKYLDETDSNPIDVGAMCTSLVENYESTYGSEDDPYYPSDAKMCKYYERNQILLNGTSVDTYCCDSGTSPVDGFVNFDNFGVGAFVVLQVMTVDGWNEIAWPTARGVDAWIALAYFFFVVLIGGFFVLQLFTSVICATLGDLEDETASQDKQTLGGLVAGGTLSESSANVSAYASSLFLGMFSSRILEESFRVPSSSELQGVRGSVRVRLQTKILVADRRFINFINAVIVLNTFTMMSVTAEPNASLESFRYGAEIFFFATFVLEFCMKNFAYGPKAYWYEKWNRLDGLIVITGSIDVVMENISTSSGGGLNFSFLRILRIFRLLRIVRLFKSNKSFERIVQSVLVGGQRIWVFLLVWFIFIVMFAVLGTQLFSAKGTLDDERLNFKDFFSSVVTLFVVSTGENTFEVAWATMKASGDAAGIYMIVWCLITTSILALVLGILIDSITESAHEMEIRKKRRGPRTRLAIDMATKLGFDPEDIPDWIMNKADAIIDAGNAHDHISECDDAEQGEDVGEEDDSQDDDVDEEELENTAGVIDFFKRGEDANAKLSHKERLQKLHHVHEVAVVRHWLVSMGYETHTEKSLEVARTMRRQSVLRARQRLDSVHRMTEAKRARIKRLASERLEHKIAADGQGKTLLETSMRCILTRSEDLNATMKLSDINADQIPYHAFFGPDEHDDEQMTFVKQDNFRLTMSFYNIDEETAIGSRRLKALKVVKHPWFDRFILLLILSSSAMLATETQTFPVDGTSTATIYFWVDVFFNACFTVEMFLKCYALTALKSHGAYLKSKFNIMDAMVVSVSWFIVVIGDALPIRSLRVLRVLRPLRTVQRVKGLRIVVEAIMSSIPAVGSVCAIGVAMLAMLSVLGMELFLGKMHRCTLTSTSVTTRVECIAAGGVWRKAKFNFDSFPEAFLSVFIIATGDNWQDIMFETMDIVGVDVQPVYNHSPMAAAYFLLCVLVAMLLWSNLFISALVDNFNRIAKGDGDGLMLVTEDQRMWQHAMLLAVTHADNEWRRIPPSIRWKAWIHRFVSQYYFDALSVTMILINMGVVMAIRSDATQAEDDFQTFAGNALAGWYCLEAFLLIAAMKWHHYWKSGWNKIDFIVALSGAIGLMVPSVYKSGYGAAFRMLRFLRLFKVVQVSKGLRTLFATFLSALPGVVNVACLSLLFMFIYACLGVSFFGDISASYTGGSLSEYSNFSDWPKAMVTLFVCYTGNWQGYFADVYIDDRCYDDAALPDGVSCERRYLAVFFFVTYVICGVFFLGNLFITIILDRFSFCASVEGVYGENGGSNLIFTTVRLQSVAKSITRHMREVRESGIASTVRHSKARDSGTNTPNGMIRSKEETPKTSRLGSVLSRHSADDASLEAFDVMELEQRLDNVNAKLVVVNAAASSPSSTDRVSDSTGHSRSASLDIDVEELKIILADAMQKQGDDGALNVEQAASAVERFVRSQSRSRSLSRPRQDHPQSNDHTIDWDAGNRSDEEVLPLSSSPSTPQTAPRGRSATKRAFDNRRQVEAASARIALASSAGSSRHASSSEDDDGFDVDHDVHDDDDDDYHSVASRRRASTSILRSTGSVRSRSVSRHESPEHSENDDDDDDDGESVDGQL